MKVLKLAPSTMHPLELDLWMGSGHTSATGEYNGHAPMPMQTRRGPKHVRPAPNDPATAVSKPLSYFGNKKLPTTAT